MNTVANYLSRLRIKHSRRNKAAAVLLCLSLIVAGSTVWSLRITGESRSTQVYCGLEEHKHTEECIERVLVCGCLEHLPGHIHDESCYTYRTELSCTIEDGEHVHDESCYTSVRILSCGYEEDLGGETVEAEAPAETPAPVETEAPQPGHTHDESCYETRTLLICELEETIPEPQPENEPSDETDESDETEPVATPEPQPGHIHGESCYTTETVLICTLEETPSEAESPAEATQPPVETPEPAVGHIHTDDCYEITYICGFEEEHTHSLSCYSNPDADTETAEDWERTVATADLSGDYAADLVAVAKTQLGYTESEDNYQVVLDDEGRETEEVRGYTRFGAWYGLPYGDWNALFVSFCLHYAGVPESLLPPSADCSGLLSALSLYFSAEAYTPNAGDLVFFDRSLNGSADHVGIVSDVICDSEGTPVGIKAIQGDFDNAVCICSYELGEETILGYGQLSYTDTDYVEETAADWDAMFSELELSGIYTQDLLSVAETQLGYTEMQDGYTRYGAWYGLPREQWCAMFIAFCLHYAGVPEDAFPIDASCPDWIETLCDDDWGLFVPSGMGYVPSPGDIIFFDWNQDGSCDHVGIVSAVNLDEDEQPVSIETIEGNTAEHNVSRGLYSADCLDIMGYGLLSIYDEQLITLAAENAVSHPALSYISDTSSKRAYMEYTLPTSTTTGSNTTYTYGILRQTVLYVYAQAGETICLGSDIYNSIIDENDVKQSTETGADIVLIEPNGTKHTFNTELNGKGYIGTCAQEKAGANFTGSGNTQGYKPHEFTAPVTGTYEVRFHSYSGERANGAPAGTKHQSSNTDPTNKVCTDNDWVNSPVTVGAYDITVVNDGKVKTGRAYAKYLALNIGSNNVTYHMNKYVVTEDGYIYNVDSKLDPFGFVFFGNNRGIIDKTTGEAAYHSYKGKENSTTLDQLNISIHSPANPDTADDQTYKIFFEEPDPILENIIYNKAFAPEHITDVEFVGAKEGNITYVGNGGYFKFNVNSASSVSITLDFSHYNEVNHTEYQTVTLRAHVSSGMNYIYWDGNDAAGNELPAAYYSNSYVDVTVQTHAGEFHFAFLDVENSTYAKIERVNAIYDYVDGVLTNVTSSYDSSKYTIYYDNSVTAANKSKYIKATNVDKIANGFDASGGVDSSVTSATSENGVLKYGSSAGDFAFLDVWTYTVNTTEANVGLDIVIQELHGYDPITLTGLVFFDRDKDSVYDISNGDFPLANVEVALDYYYCGTRWYVTRADPDDPNSSITLLTPAAQTHSEWTQEDSSGIPIDPHEVVDYYYHNYEVRWETDENGANGAYYLYEYAAADKMHQQAPSPVMKADGISRVTVSIEAYNVTETETDYKVWIPVHRTTTTGSTGEYIFSGVLVNQNINVGAEETGSYFNYIVSPVTNPDANLYTLTTGETVSGDFQTTGLDDAQIIKLSELEGKILAAGSNATNLSYSVADVGYWFRLYDSPLTIQKVWGDDALSTYVSQITVELEGFGVEDGVAYYHRELSFTAQDGWKTTPTDIPAVALKVDAAGNPILDPETNLPKEQALSYRVTWEKFTIGEVTYRFIRDYANNTVTYQKAVPGENDSITWETLGETPQPYESFILDLKHTITGDIIYVENWAPGSTTLKLTKRSAADSTVLLPGATFELLKLNTVTSQYESIRTGYGGSYMLTTDDYGVAEFHGLTAGNYMLREVMAPADYRKADNILFKVELDDDGQAYIVDNDSGTLTVYDDLDEPPASGIAKYDQYDKLMLNSGAEFEVYAANSSYEKQGAAVATVTIGDSGRTSFMTSDGNGGTRPLYISELRARLNDSKYFVLKESVIPEGYRSIGEAHMEILGSGMSTYVECRNPFDSGVWSGQKVTVYAPETLQIANSADYGKISSDRYVDENGVIQYASYTNNGKITGTGTLFAVVLKRCGAEPGVTELEKLTFEGWRAVYGDDIHGYTVGGSTMSDIIAAAKASHEDYGNNVFTPNKAGVSMNATLHNLPGESTRYFTYMYENNIAGSATEPQYVVAYYYSTASTLEGATADNTVRVTSHGLVGEADDFRLYWATEIEIPDIGNALFVQKTDSDENPVDNAVFALYDAASDSDGNGYYLGKNSSGGTVYIRLAEDDTKTAVIYDESFNEISSNGSYTVNTTDFAAKLATLTTDMLLGGNAYLTSMFPELENPGVITVTADGQTYTLTPAKNANNVSCMTVTHEDCLRVNEGGSGHLRYLKNGQYYLKELYVPAGYALNYTNVEVSVTEKGVYANAGTAEDGVRVGNGPGYLVSTMNVFASVGEIDETLSYIVGAMRLKTGGSDFVDMSEISSWPYVCLDANNTTKYIFSGSEETSAAIAKATVLYLRYAGSANHPDINSEEALALFDYTVNEGAEFNSANLIRQLRFWTESGWSDMAVFQHYTYGYNQLSTNSTTKYTNLTLDADGNPNELSDLFSGSTFVRFKDESATDLKVTKIDSLYPDRVLQGASFVLYSVDEDNTKYYYTYSADGKTSWEALTAGKTERDCQLTTGADGSIEFKALTNGTYYLRELTAPPGYDPLVYDVVLTVRDCVITMLRSDGVGIGTNSRLTLTSPSVPDTVGGRYAYTLTVPNNGGYKLPSTGGAGNYMFTVGGLALVAVTLVYGCGLRRRHERRTRENAS